MIIEVRCASKIFKYEKNKKTKKNKLKSKEENLQLLCTSTNVIL